MTMMKWLRSSQAVIAMLSVQLFATGMQLLSKIILTNGTFVFSLMVYRHIIASLCVAPLALYFERGVMKKLTWSLFFWIFLSGLVGITMAMSLYYYGLKDTTATYAVNFLNLIPIVTFILSIILRIEKLGLSTRAGKLKTFGAALCVAGALTTGLYKGHKFHLTKHRSHHSQLINHVDESKIHWLRGSFMLTGSCFCYAIWYILQVKLLSLLPMKYWVTLFTCIMATIQSAAAGLCLDRSEAAWKLGWNLQLITIVYSGSLATAATFCLITWAVAKKGPTYPSMFNPLTLIFVAILEALILGSDLTVGNLLGMVMIIGGLYSFLWGKKAEARSFTKSQPVVENVIEVNVAIPESVDIEQSTETLDKTVVDSTK